MTTIQEELHELRMVCFGIENRLPVFSPVQEERLTSEQAIRLRLYNLRHEIDNIQHAVKELEIR